MQPWVIKYKMLAGIFTGLLAAADACAAAVHLLGWWPFTVPLFICTALLPGMVLLRIIRVTFRTVPIYILYAFGLSLLVLLLGGVITNFLLSVAGIARPLDGGYIFAAWNITVCCLIACSAFVNRTVVVIRQRNVRTIPKPAWALTALSCVLPIFATFGAWRLNNGSDGLVALMTLCLAAALIIYACVARHKIPDGAMAWFIFMLGLSILLMTSMRGWDMVGHDIEREFRVFMLVAQEGRWDIALYRDPYNACLSITILPHMLSTMLGISGIIVFKVLLQLAFAGCVAVIYLLLRQYTPKLGALAGSLLFICYPTFINDAAMLTRQGVAYLFFALAILIISSKSQYWRHKSLFLLCAVGAVLSHYSTAYMFVSLFALAVACKYIATWWLKRKPGAVTARREKTVLSPLFAGALFLMTFIWYAQITATSSGLFVTLQESLANVPSLFTDESKSSDLSGVLFSNSKTQADLYEEYMSGTRTTQSSDADILPGLTEDTMAPTPLGKQLHHWGMDLSIPNVLRQHFARVLQILAVAGVAYAAYRFIRHKPHAQGLDFTCLSIASIIVLGLMVVLPVLSVNYGILRAFQQTLIFLVLPIVLLLVRFMTPLHRKLTNGIAITGLTLLFLLFTGVTAQVLGGTSPPITLNNQGLYYGLYYSSAADRASFDWLRNTIPHTSDVRAANFNRALMNDPQYPFNRSGILPTQTTPDSYVYLDSAQIRDEKFYTYYESSPLTLTFPVQYYTVTKNQIYSTATTGVFK